MVDGGIVVAADDDCQVIARVVPCSSSRQAPRFLHCFAGDAGLGLYLMGLLKELPYGDIIGLKLENGGGPRSEDGG